jgi:hypothetical protein
MVVSRLKKRRRPQKLREAKLVARDLECAVLLLDATSATLDKQDFEQVKTRLGIPS